MINNGNWTLWSAIWVEIIRMIWITSTISGFFSLYKCFLDPEMSWFVESCKRDFFLFSNNFIGVFEQLVVVF